MWTFLWVFLANSFSQVAVFNITTSYSPRFWPVSASIPGGVSHAAEDFPLQGTTRSWYQTLFRFGCRPRDRPRDPNPTFVATTLREAEPIFNNGPISGEPNVNPVCHSRLPPRPRPADGGISVFLQSQRMITPSGTTPSVASRQRATSSLRASATIIRLRFLP